MSDGPNNNIVPFDGAGTGPSVPSRGDTGGGIGSGVVQLETKDGTGVSVYADGSVAISAPHSTPENDFADDKFDRNLAEGMDEAILAQIATEVIEGVEADIQTRGDLVNQYELGIELIGSRIEDVSTPSTAGRSISRIGHPLLIESMIKGHSGMEAEMLPAEGPAKVQTIGQPSKDEEQLAADFESDFNYYLTEIAPEYYPDTSRMIMGELYCGNGYKKIYRCAMRDRPVSESVSMLDLIVSEEATDLENATRVTHQVQMTRAQIRRMQIAGRYRDFTLGQSQAERRPGDAAIKQSEGLSGQSQRPQDIPYMLWETDLDLDREFYTIEGKWERAAPKDFPLPYKVTVDKNTRQVLGIWRNWKDGDKFYRKRNMYVHFGMVPSLGFHFWGFLQILGNHTRALRAIWRLLIDAGMFSNFPGGVKLKGARTATNEIAPGPGEWIDIDAPAGNDIRQMLMPLPYKTIDAVFVQLAQMIEEGAQRLGGSVMIETGEGRTNVPVGTVMSMVEQQTQVIAGVHRRNHQAQKQELRKLRELFVENPQDLWRLARDPKRRWAVGQEFADLNLVPASDPNIPAQVHRIMQAWALSQIAMANPQLYDMREVNMRLLRTIRVSAPETLLTDPNQQAAAQQGPSPEQLKMQALQEKGKQDQAKHGMKMQEIAAGQQGDAVQAKQDAQTAALESADRAADRQESAQATSLKAETDRMKIEAEQKKAQQQLFGGPGA